MHITFSLDLTSLLLQIFGMDVSSSLLCNFIENRILQALPVSFTQYSVAGRSMGVISPPQLLHCNGCVCFPGLDRIGYFKNTAEQSSPSNPRINSLMRRFFKRPCESLMATLKKQFRSLVEVVRVDSTDFW